MQFQKAVAKLAAREPGRDHQLLASEVFLTDPGSDDCEELNHTSAIDGIFCHGQKLNRPGDPRAGHPLFAQVQRLSGQARRGRGRNRAVLAQSALEQHGLL